MMSSLAEDGASILWILAPELMYNVVTFLDGKALSSMLEALLSCKQRRYLLHSLMHYIMRRYQDEIVNFLAKQASSPQPELLVFIKESIIPRSAAISFVGENPTIHRAINKDASTMRQFSEWCLLMDYILQGLRSRQRTVSSTLSSSQDCMARMLWPVGVGVFATSPVCGGNIPLQSKVIVTCPVWDPAAVILCHDLWLPQKSTQQHQQTSLETAPTHHFSWLPSEGDIDGFVPEVFSHRLMIPIYERFKQQKP